MISNCSKNLGEKEPEIKGNLRNFQKASKIIDQEHFITFQNVWLIGSLI